MASSYTRPVAAIILVTVTVILLPILQAYEIIPTLSVEIVHSIFTLLIGVVIYSFISPLLSRIPDEKSRFLFRKVLLALVAVIVIIGLLSVWVQELSFLALSLGFVAAGLAISLQQPIASLVGWLILALEKPFTVGDRIAINELEGDVIDYGPFFIKVMEIRRWTEADLYTGRILIIPMNWILSYSVYNYSKDFPYIWDRIWIGLLYGVDFVKIRRDVEEIARQQVSEVVTEAQEVYNTARGKYYLLEAPMEPQAFTEFDSNWIQISLRYIAPIRSRTKIRSELSSKILQYLDENNITVASSSMNVNLNRALKEKPD